MGIKGFLTSYKSSGKANKEKTTKQLTSPLGIFDGLKVGLGPFVGNGLG